MLAARSRLKESIVEDAEVQYEEVKALLVQANRALDQLKHHTDNQSYRATFQTKADLHGSIGEYNMAITLLRQTDELYLAAERNGSIDKLGHDLWANALASLGFYCLESHQLEAAKRCLLRILNWPHPMTAGDRVDALQGMARYYKERKDWPNVFKYCRNRSGPSASRNSTSTNAMSSPTAGLAGGCRRRTGRFEAGTGTRREGEEHLAW